MVQTIPVFFATKDDQYINYLYVSITSVLINAETKTHYNFYILVPSDFSETTKKKSNNYRNSIQIVLFRS